MSDLSDNEESLIMKINILRFSKAISTINFFCISICNATTSWREQFFVWDVAAWCSVRHMSSTFVFTTACAFNAQANKLNNKFSGMKNVSRIFILHQRIENNMSGVVEDLLSFFWREAEFSSVKNIFRCMALFTWGLSHPLLFSVAVRIAETLWN
jgi:hypothetical protein